MSNKMISNAISTILAMGIATVNTSALGENASEAKSAQPMEQDMSQMINLKDMEKCYGIAKAGQNDCGTATHGCAGESRIDGDKAEWILVPTGLCQKIAGGSTKAPNKT